MAIVIGDEVNEEADAELDNEFKDKEDELEGFDFRRDDEETLVGSSDKEKDDDFFYSGDDNE